MDGRGGGDSLGGGGGGSLGGGGGGSLGRGGGVSALSSDSSIMGVNVDVFSIW